jgi:hypothetical protein
MQSTGDRQKYLGQDLGKKEGQKAESKHGSEHAR